LIFKIGGIFDKVGENYRKFKQLLGEVLDEIGGIYYRFGKNSEQIGENSPNWGRVPSPGLTF
jgi:hypothetical protein